MITLEIFSMLLFFSLVGIYILREREGVKFKYGIITKRWKKQIRKIDKFVSKHAKFTRIFGLIGIITGIVVSFYGIYLLFHFSIKREPAIGVILPTVSGLELPKPIIGVQFWYWLPSIFILSLVHETSHAILGRLSKVRIKNYGVILFFLLPVGAFVELEKRDLRRLSSLKKLMVYCGGSFANLLVVVLVMGLVIFSNRILEAIVEPIGLEYEVITNTSAEKAGLNGVIVEIDGETIRTVSDLERVLSTKKPGEMIEIKTNISTFEIILGRHPKNESLGYIGIKKIRSVLRNKMTGDIVPKKIMGFIGTWFNLLYWTFIINLGVGIFNLLPLKPFDGGYVYEEILVKSFGERNGKSIANFLTFLIVSLILFNLILASRSWLRL
jgi:membrane-associated protease RseP (regulator of RpoE activity)